MNTYIEMHKSIEAWNNLVTRFDEFYYTVIFVIIFVHRLCSLTTTLLLLKENNNYWSKFSEFKKRGKTNFRKILITGKFYNLIEISSKNIWRKMSSLEKSKGGQLSFLQKFAYSVGHVLNDLTASMWFTYMIIYFHQVKKFNNSLSGDLVLIGQISDAIFTPFIGYESDRVKGCCNMGKRKTWHFIGEW